ncbi:VOC family protein [Saccharopolyspora sp. NPDC000995]
MELSQVRLLVADFPSCYRFYRDVLRLKPQFEAPDGPYAKFSPDGGTAAIALQDRAQMTEVLGELGEPPTAYRSLVVLRLDDLDGYCAEITARGAELLNGPAPMTDRMRAAHLKDPAGNLIELQEWLATRG